ncbi:MAG: ribonuclease H-like domain-containing protein [Planctomycetota bacterium]
MDASDQSRQRRLDALNREPLEHKSGSAEVDDLQRRLRKGRKSGSGDGERNGPSAKASAEAGSSSVEPIVVRRDLPRSSPVAASIDLPVGPPVALDEAVSGSDVTTSDGRRVFLVERTVEEGGEVRAALCEALGIVLADRESGLWRQLRHIGVDGDIRAEDLLFFDLETTGLSSSPLFLIGAMVWEDGRLVTRQYFARDYSQEGGVVELFLALATERKLLVTFNGKTFDAPFVRTRAAANGISCALAHAHLDLLHAARRVWKGRLPDCKLQTLERHICGRARHDDIPGHLIPDAYHAYVRTGNAAQMVNVLEHNFLDLVTLADIMTRFPRPAPEAGSAPEAGPAPTAGKDAADGR